MSPSRRFNMPELCGDVQRLLMEALAVALPGVEAWAWPF